MQTPGYESITLLDVQIRLAAVHTISSACRCAHHERPLEARDLA